MMSSGNRWAALNSERRARKQRRQAVVHGSGRLGLAGHRLERRDHASFLRFASGSPPAALIKTEISGTGVSIASFLRPVRSENGRPARDFGPDKTVECSRVALVLGWYRAAELGQSLAYIRLIKGLVEGNRKPGDH